MTAEPVPVTAEVVVDARELRRAIKRVRHAASEEYVRPILNTIAFQADGDALRLVAADNYRLATLTVAVASGAVADVAPFCLWLDDIDTLRPWLKSVEKPVAIERTQQVVTFRCGDRSIAFQGADGKYPNHQPIVEQAAARTDTRTVTLNPALLAGLPLPLLHLTIAGPTDPVIWTSDDGYVEYLMPIGPTEVTVVADPEPAS